MRLTGCQNLGVNDEFILCIHNGWITLTICDEIHPMNGEEVFFVLINKLGKVNC